MAAPVCPIHHRPMLAPRNGKGPHFCPARDETQEKGYCVHKAYPVTTPTPVPAPAPAPQAARPAPTPVPLSQQMLNEGAPSKADFAKFETLAVGCLHAALKAYCGEGSLDEAWHPRVLVLARTWFQALRDDIEVLP